MKPGSAGNVTAGMEFDVYKQGEDLIDPDTGHSLGKEETKIGRVKVVSDMVNGKACKAQVVSGTGLTTANLIRLPKE
jgi:hypothetical protein